MKTHICTQSSKGSQKGKEKAAVSRRELSQGSQKANVKCGGTTISSELWFGK